MAIGKESLIRTLKATIGITMLIVGGLLYIIYRTEHLLMFSWFHKIGLSPIIEFIQLGEIKFTSRSLAIFLSFCDRFAMG